MTPPNGRTGAASATRVELDSLDASHMDFGDRLLKAEDLEREWQVPASWVRAEARAGRLPSVKLGHYRRFVRADVEAWLEQQRGRR